MFVQVPIGYCTSCSPRNTLILVCNVKNFSKCPSIFEKYKYGLAPVLWLFVQSIVSGK